MGIVPAESRLGSNVRRVCLLADVWYPETMTPTQPALSRTKTIELLKALMLEGFRLGTGDLTVKLSERFEAPIINWRAKARSVLEQVGADAAWISEVCSGADTRPSLRISVEHVGAVLTLTQKRKPLTLNPNDLAILRLRASLSVWGDYVIDVGTGRSQTAFFANDSRAFVSDELPGLLDEARARASSRLGVARNAVDNAAKLTTSLDVDSLRNRENPEVWHAGWALLSLGWWFGDAIELPIRINCIPVVAFTEAKVVRNQYLDVRSSDCPRCHTHVILQNATGSKLRSVLWRCESCDVGGYFPVAAHPTSEWMRTNEGHTDATAFATIDSDARDAPAASIDLSWMVDPRLQKVAQEDAVDMEVCFAAKAWKATLLLAGSVTEAMLLDVLERNVPVAANYMKKSADFPDKASLDHLLEMATTEGLLSATVGELAPITRSHRDLIHPNRMRAGSIVVDRHTATALHNLVGLIARDLGSAASDGRIAAYTAKVLGS